MFTYKPCSEVTISQIFEAFNLGFSDYIAPVKLEEHVFQTQFFGPEGNQYELSYLAFDDNRPVGLILGGIRLFDGIKTMRCGTLCIAPDYRGKGISQSLFELHKKAAIQEGCKQLFLEVILENYRAVKFYKKLDYREAYVMKYYSNEVTSIPALKSTNSYPIVTISYDTIKATREGLKACHINWQSDTPYFENSTKDVYLGIYKDDRLVAAIAANPRGKINLLWVEPDYRQQGLAHSLLLAAAKNLKVEKMNVCIPGNALLEGFFRKMEFQKDKLEQLEMYLPL